MFHREVKDGQKIINSNFGLEISEYKNIDDQDSNYIKNENNFQNDGSKNIINQENILLNDNKLIIKSTDNQINTTSEILSKNSDYISNPSDNLDVILLSDNKHNQKTFE